MTATIPTAAAIAAAEAVLAGARAEHAITMTKVTAAYNAVETLRKAVADDVLAGRSADEFWTDATLREFVIERDWSGGRGDRDASAFIAAAIEDLSPGDFYQYDRYASGDRRTVVRIAPRIKMTYRQDTAAVHAALLTMLPILTATDASGEGDSFLAVSVFEHTCSEFGSIAMKVYSADRAVIFRGGYDEFTGTLADALVRVASDFWYDGGPEQSDEDSSDW